MHEGAAQTRSREAGGEEAVEADQPQARPLGQAEGDVGVDRAGGREDEEQRRETGTERHRARVGEQLAYLRPVDRLPCSRLRAHELAVDLGQADRDRRAHQEGRHLRRARRVALERHDERKPDDRAVDHAGDVSRAEMSLDRASQRADVVRHVGTVVGGPRPGKETLLPIACVYARASARWPTGLPGPRAQATVGAWSRTRPR
ncbi:MAG TPA: hypothetical protein VF257_01335 [Solirubrobacteraceae bacterium]